MRDIRVVGLCVLMILWALFLCCCADKPVVFVKNCTADLDCSVKESMCADGVDPYHVCSEGRCVNLTFIQNPCLAGHICPKGNWYLVLNNSCFTERRCQESGCDDGSPDTFDECINHNLRYEGCKYTVLDRNSSDYCLTDSDCAVESSRCADGVDPYHVCMGGKCTNLTFIQNPCIASHVCPKGEWVTASNDSCFRYANCRDAGCDDGSDKTIDACVNIGTRSEGCRYIIKSESACVSDKDCAPEQCCHPTSCINAGYTKPCDGIMCTMECRPGTMDCGAGSCACVDNKCTVKYIK